MSTPHLPPSPDAEDLVGLARGMRVLFELAARTLTDDTGPPELARRITGHLGCELPAVVQVAERFPSWEYVNIQSGVDAYLAARRADAEWFGVSGLGHRPHEDILSLVNMASPFGRIKPSAASYGTAAVGPEENTEVVIFGLATATSCLPSCPGR